EWPRPFRPSGRETAGRTFMGSAGEPPASDAMSLAGRDGGPGPSRQPPREVGPARGPAPYAQPRERGGEGKGRPGVGVGEGPRASCRPPVRRLRCRSRSHATLVPREVPMSRTIVSRGGARTAAALAIGSAFLLSACAGSDAGANVVAYEGARVIPGDGSGPIDDAVFLVENGRFTAVGPRAQVDVPSGATRVDLAGRTVIPALVNAHVHLSSDRAERLEQARHYAYYGQGTLASLGLDDGTVGYEMSDELVPGAARTLSAGPGITSPEPGRSEVPFWVSTEEEARAAVRHVAAY